MDLGAIDFVAEYLPLDGTRDTFSADAKAPANEL
jgi:hypothetical protein